MSVPNPDQLGSVSRRLASCIRMLLSPNDSERAAAILGVQRTRRTISEDRSVDIHALADRIEKSNGGLSDADKQRIRAEIENARAVGYAEGVQAAARSLSLGLSSMRMQDASLRETDPS